MIDIFIKDQYKKQNNIWFSTGYWDQELIGIRYKKSDNIIQIQVSQSNIIEFRLKGIWLFASPSDYNSIIWLDAEQLPFYLINGDESSSMSIVNGKYLSLIHILKNASKFLGEGNKVKVTIMFRGRELSHPELGMAVLTRFAEELKETASIEKAAKLEGRNMTMILVSK